MTMMITMITNKDDDNNDTDEGYLKSIELGAGGVVGNNR